MSSVAALVAGDFALILLQCMLGRFNHGEDVIDFDTLKTAFPFLVGELSNGWRESK